MTDFPHDLEDTHTPTLGLIVLQVDETIETDFRRMLPPDTVRLHVTRIPSGADLTPETIAGMEATLPAAAALLPPAARFDAIGYACTSGTTLIGAARVRELILQATPSAAVTDPLTAALAALRALGLRRIGLVSPYVAEVAAPVAAAFQSAGVEVAATLSFGQQVEARVARIAPASIRAAATALAGETPMDGLFLSCTNLRTLDVLPVLEAELQVPVLSSNQLLAWHMARAAGLSLPGPGHLFTV